MSRPSRPLSAPLALLVCVPLSMLVGCADDVVDRDASLDGAVDGGEDAGPLVTPPNIPWLADGVPPIMLTPCPEGWREVPGGLATECDPYPVGGPASCADGEAHFLGEPGCRPIGEPCPSGDYATSLPDGGSVLYVKAGAPAGGDGTSAAPFAGVGEVPWASLAAGAMVALAKGTYPGALPLRAGVNVIGACAKETVLTGASLAPSVVTVTNAGEPATVRNLSIRGALQGGVSVSRGRSLRLQGVLIEGVRGVGVFGSDPGTELSFTDVVIRDTEASETDATAYGTGIHLQSGAHLDATRLDIAGNRVFGVLALEEGTFAKVTDSVIRDTQTHHVEGVFGRGIHAEIGAQVDAARVLIVRNQEAGVSAAGLGALVTMTDSIIRDTESRARDGYVGRGVSLEFGGSLIATRLLVAGNRGTGVSVADPPGMAQLTDVVIRDTTPSELGESPGRGLNVQQGARCDATRLLVSGNAETGIRVSDAQSVASVVATVVRDTVATRSGADGRGVWAQFGARFEARELVVSHNREVAIGASGAATVVDLTDTIVRETQAQATDRDFGWGLSGQEGAHVGGVRLEVDASLDTGVYGNSGATLILRDTSIRDVQMAECGSTTCSDMPNGYGAVAYAASLTMTRFRVTRAATCGVMVAALEGHPEGASLDLHQGVVSMSEIGACVQVPGYDFGRLTDDVQYRDNDTNLDSTSLPVPAPIDPL